MKIFQLLFLLVLIVPFVEIYLLLQVGAIIGALPTIILVVFTALLGSWLLKQQGFATLQRFQTSLNNGEIPAYEMIEGPIILVGGALLLTPGFVTDLLGFACLIPQLRRKIAQYVIENFLVNSTAQFRQRPSQQADALEGEFNKED
jgi:UPF0716 protein FxsA